MVSGSYIGTLGIRVVRDGGPPARPTPNPGGESSRGDGGEGLRTDCWKEPDAHAGCRIARRNGLYVANFKPSSTSCRTDFGIRRSGVYVDLIVMCEPPAARHPPRSPKMPQNLPTWVNQRMGRFGRRPQSLKEAQIRFWKFRDLLPLCSMNPRMFNNPSTTIDAPEDLFTSLER